MKKYYVGSGKYRWTLSAKNTDAAVVRFVNLALKPAFVQGQQKVKQYQVIDWQIARELIAQFGTRINVSEQGFSPREFDSFPTKPCLLKWQRQIQALEQLIRQSK